MGPPLPLSSRKGVQKKLTSCFPRTLTVARIAAGLMVIWGVYHAFSFTSSIDEIDTAVAMSQQKASVTKQDEIEIASTNQQLPAVAAKQPTDPITASDKARASEDSPAVNKQSSSPVVLERYYTSDACEEGTNMTTTKVYAAHREVSIRFPEMPKSMRVVGEGQLKLYGMGKDADYIASLVEMEGCIKVYLWPSFDRGVLQHGNSTWRIDPALQQKFSTAPDLSKPHTRIVFSCESSEYFGYQVTTNAYAFLQSNQTDASWLRLLTAHEADDLSESLPTFQAPRTLYSKRYSPINKPDILEKWFHSEDAPHPDDTIVVIDPDNWLLKDLHPWTEKVSRNHAYGQGAYYHGNSLVQTLWNEVCKVGCNSTVDAVGVPYVIKASNLKEVLPLWRHYTILLDEMRQNEKERFKKQYETLYIDWTSEMYGYNFACAHLGIKTTTAWDLQIRDVDNSKHMSKEQLDKKPMIHMGRAWFPDKDAALAEPWRHTGGGDFASFGIQVWCKCNSTGSVIMPWPIPDDLDLVSYHTLRLLHEARQWMPVPINDKYRNASKYYHSTP